MRECAIQFVDYTPSGDYLGLLNQATARTLALEAGGCSIIPNTVGVWCDPEGEMHVDRGARVVVACEPEVVPVLRDIAAHYAREAGQQCVYFANGHTGEVEFIDPAPAEVEPPSWIISVRRVIAEAAEVERLAMAKPEGTA